MTAIPLLRIQKALEDVKAEELKVTSDLKYERQKLGYNWESTPEIDQLLIRLGQLITRRVELETALKIIAEYEERV